MTNECQDTAGLPVEQAATGFQDSEQHHDEPNRLAASQSNTSSLHRRVTSTQSQNKRTSGWQGGFISTKTSYHNVESKLLCEQELVTPSKKYPGCIHQSALVWILCLNVKLVCRLTVGLSHALHPRKPSFARPISYAIRAKNFLPAVHPH